MYEFRKASNDFKFQMEEELRTSEDADRRQKEDERQRALVQPQQQPNCRLFYRPRKRLLRWCLRRRQLKQRPAWKLPCRRRPRAASPTMGSTLRDFPAPMGWAKSRICASCRFRREQVPAARPTAKIVQAELFAEPSMEAAPEQARKLRRQHTMVDASDVIGKARSAVSERADLPA